MAHRSMRPRTTDMRKVVKRLSECPGGHIRENSAGPVHIENRVAGARVTATVADAAGLVETLTSSSCSSSSSASGILDEMRQHTSLSRHLLLLDGAVDRCASDTLLSLREEGRFAWGGFGIRREPTRL